MPHTFGEKENSLKADLANNETVGQLRLGSKPLLARSAVPSRGSQHNLSVVTFLVVPTYQLTTRTVPGNFLGMPHGFIGAWLAKV